MPLSIYNSLTRQKEEFRPIDPAGRRVTIYNCGPTVYDRFHIGNARNFVVMDTVRRYLEWLGYEVRFVQNLTDIDDKIIQRAHEENRDWREVTGEFTKAYFEDAAKLGVRPADDHPRATEYVAEMIAFMQELVGAGYAYAAGGSVYFRVRKFAEYGKLSGRNIEDLLEGARVEVNDEKEDPLDFVLWKASKPGEPTWPSPWGEGRPGWHTECAVMTRELLGDTLDIHSGGSDLRFPHHENELAQRECLSHKPFARYWMHNGFLNIDSEKMSKSLGNFKRIDQVLEKFSAGAVRFFLLSAVYRNPLDYNEAALEEANAAVRRINDGIETGEKLLRLQGRAIHDAEWSSSDPRVTEFVLRFEEAMNDDFNTPRALAVLHDIVSAIHEARQFATPDYDRLLALVLVGRRLRSFFGLSAIEAASLDSASEVISPGSIEHELLFMLRELHTSARDQKLGDLSDLIESRLSSVGVKLDDIEAARISKDQLLDLLIEARKLSRKLKAFAVADSIRNRLAEKGIALEDHAQGTIWKHVETSGAAR